MNKKSLILGILIIYSTLLFAKIVNVDGLTYILDENHLTASVTYKNAGTNQERRHYSFKRVVIPSSIWYDGSNFRVSSISDAAFDGCRKLSEITIPYGIDSIGNKAFQSCGNIKTLTMPNSVKFIGKSAFAYCDNLTSIVLSGQLKSINESAFRRCRSLKSIDIPGSVESILYGAFDGCTNLLQVTFHDGLEGIGRTAFMDCRALTSISFPSTFSGCGEVAFRGCKSLKSVTIPKTATSIGRGTFAGCSQLQTINVEPGNKRYCSEDGVLFTINKNEIVQYPAGKNTVTYDIPYGVKTIYRLAFEKCSNLTTLNIPNSVKTIEINAIYDCPNLQSVFIPQSVKSIEGTDNTIFDGCPKLQEIRYEKGFQLSVLKPHLHQLCIMTENPIPPKQNYATNQNAQIGISGDDKIYIPSKNDKKIHDNPPLLSLINGTISFHDFSENNCIDANEQCTIKFSLKNNGKGAAKNCEARVKLTGTTAGISTKTIKLPTINAGEFLLVSIPITSNANTQDGQVTFSIEVYEPNGWGMEPFDLNVTTKAFEAPLLQVTNFKISTPSGKVHRMEYATLLFDVQNIKYGNAENVHVRVILPDNIAVIDGETDLSFPMIKPGEIKSSQLDFVVNKNYVESTIPIIVDIKEKYGKYADSKNIEVELATTASSVANITAKEEKSTYKIVSVKDNALIILEKPSINILQNTSVAILCPKWFNRYNNPQNIKSPFPYAAIKLELNGDKEAIEIAKERLSLMMGGKHIVEAKDTKETNTIWFLVHCRNEYIDLDCGDGCEPINIRKERLEPNRVYTGEVYVAIP